jgi:hypothetical protein
MDEVMDIASEKMESISDLASERTGRNSTLMTVLAAIGLIAIGAIVIPALVGLIAAAPDIRRYLHIRRM